MIIQQHDNLNPQYDDRGSTADGKDHNPAKLEGPVHSIRGRALPSYDPVTRTGLGKRSDGEKRTDGTALKDKSASNLLSLCFAWQPTSL